MSYTLLPDVLKKYKATTFVETGTYDGRGVLLALSCGFTKVHSIEIDPGRFKSVAMSRLGEAAGVQLYLGDTVDILPQIVASLEERAVIWLDAHPIGKDDTCPRGKNEWPLVAELEILRLHSKRRDHHILIDDRDCFGKLFNTSDEQLKSLILAINPAYKFTLEPNTMHPDDILAAYVEAS